MSYSSEEADDSFHARQELDMMSHAINVCGTFSLSLTFPDTRAQKVGRRLLPIFRSRDVEALIKLLDEYGIEKLGPVQDLMMHDHKLLDMAEEMAKRGITVTLRMPRIFTEFRTVFPRAIALYQKGIVQFHWNSFWSTGFGSGMPGGFDTATTYMALDIAPCPVLLQWATYDMGMLRENQLVTSVQHNLKLWVQMIYDNHQNAFLMVKMWRYTRGFFCGVDVSR